MAEVSTPVPAATLLLVRQRAKLEVLMVRRHHQIEFVSGALVFPGGKVSEDDAHAFWSESGAHPNLGDMERRLRIAAIREAFEESGILLARGANGSAMAGPEALAALHPLRPALAEGKESFAAAIRGAGLAAALDALAPFAHWITPEGVGRRFDTHFFIAAAPEDQVEACDGREAVEAVWVEPAAALEEGRAGKWQIVFPTRLNLERLAETESVAAALAAARARKIFTVTPEITTEDGKRVIQIPAEAGYSVTIEPFTR